MLIEKYLPDFDAREHHEMRVAADLDRAWAALERLDFGRSRIVRVLFWIRTIPSRLRPGAHGERRPEPRPFLETAVELGWRRLEEVRGREIVMGAVCKPWEPVVRFHGLPAPEFVAFADPGWAKIAWSIAAEPGGDGRAGETVLSTETRVATTDPESRRKFRRYWFFVSPGVRLIRHLGLGVVRRDLRADGSPES